MKGRTLDVVTFGECMVLFYPDATGPLRHINSFYRYMGGAEANVAVALSRLGFKAGWFSRLGDDEFGKYIYHMLRGEGVDVSHVIFDPEYPTGLMFKEKFLKKNPNVYYYRKNSAASRLSPDDVDPDYIGGAEYLHVTGITPAISATARGAVFRALEIARQKGMQISFDPNLRLKLWSADEARGVIMEIAKMSDIILCGDDEGRLLTGCRRPEEIARVFLDMGCRKVAVKLGKDGSYVAEEGLSAYVPCYPTEYKEDSAGAGDGFAAGFLAGLLSGFGTVKCAEIGNWVGALATLVRSDIEGYPDRSQFEHFLKKEAAAER